MMPVTVVPSVPPACDPVYRIEIFNRSAQAAVGDGPRIGTIGDQRCRADGGQCHCYTYDGPVHDFLLLWSILHVTTSDTVPIMAPRMRNMDGTWTDSWVILRAFTLI
jgi:hypothetical protein